MAQIFADVRSKDVGSDRRNDVWSPANVLRRLLAAVANPAPVPALVPDVPAVEKLLGGGGRDLGRSPPEFRWCWSRRPWLGALHVWGVHVMTKGNDSRLEGLLATTVLDCRRLRARCPIPKLPILMLQMHQRCPVGASVGSLTDFGGVGR